MVVSRLDILEVCVSGIVAIVARVLLHSTEATVPERTVKLTPRLAHFCSAGPTEVQSRILCALVSDFPFGLVP